MANHQQVGPGVSDVVDQALRWMADALLRNDFDAAARTSFKRFRAQTSEGGIAALAVFVGFRWERRDSASFLQ